MLGARAFKQLLACVPIPYVIVDALVMATLRHLHSLAWYDMLA